ncbi:hypothetical protein NC651_009613 [Populus alba x Populus x berolinensis]|nr:hypothetical protein NC651_009613 [Populus alba x Populus x berolinensis]
MGKVVSFAEVVKGSFVFQQGKPCPCQARQLKLVSNCLSCGKIVCGQEGEGSCSFCDALVLKEGRKEVCMLVLKKAWLLHQILNLQLRLMLKGLWSMITLTLPV